MFLHLCRKRSSTWGHMDHSWKKQRCWPIFHTGHCQHCSVTDEMTFIMYRNPKNISKVRWRENGHKTAETRDSWKEGKCRNSQHTLMAIRNHLTFWCMNLYNVICRISYDLLTPHWRLDLRVGLEDDLHAYFFRKNHTFPYKSRHTKLPPRKIVTLSHEDRVGTAQK